MTSPDDISCKAHLFLCLSVWQVVLGFVSEADYKLVAKAIRHRVTAIKRQREKQRRLLEKEPDASPKPPERPYQNTSAAETVANKVCSKSSR